MNPLALFGLSPTAWLAGGAVLVLVGLGGAYEVQTVRLKHSQAETLEVKHAWELDKAQATTAALAAAEANAATSTAWANQVRSAQNDYQTLQTTHARQLGVARGDVDKLRGQLAQFASGGGRSDDTAAAASERAAALGGLLATALQADADHAADAEANADAVRTLLAAWPH